jgi:hypothetical protein
VSGSDTAIAATDRPGGSLVSAPTRRLSLLVCLFVLVCAAAVSMNWTGLRQPAPGAHAGAGADLVPSVAERLAALDARLRLPPDGRFLAAVQQLAMLAGPTAAEPAGRVEVRRHDRSWEILHDGDAVGTLRELADFDEMLALLDAWAEKLRADDQRVFLADGAVRPDLQLLLDRYDDAAAFRVLEVVDARWGEDRASVGDLRAAAVALAQLSLILQDNLDIADAVRGRALAALALARTYGPDAALRAECLLAISLRYSSHAKRLATRLASDDPLAQLAVADLAGLRQRALRRAATDEERFFDAYRLGRDKLYAEWFEWLQRLPADSRSLALVRTYLDARDLRAMRWLPDYVAIVLQRRVRMEDPRAGDSVLARSDEYLAQLEGAASGKEGPFASADAQRTYYRALYFSALYGEYELHEWMLASPAGLSELAGSLSTARDPALREFAEFVELQNPTASGALLTGRRLKALEADSVLGAGQRFDLALSLYLPMGSEDPERLAIAAVLEPRFDARPQHLIWASQLARQVYADPALTLQLDEATVALDGVERVELQLQLARARGDVRALWNLLEEGRLAPEHRIEALTELAKLESPDVVRLRAAYARELPAPDPKRRVYWAYAELLEEVEKDRGAARRALERFIADPGQSAGLAQSHALARIARLHREDGRVAEGWAVLQPELDGAPPESVFDEAIRLQIALKDFAHAEEIARRSRARYPGANTTSDLARVLWHQGRFAEAAHAISECPDITSSRARSDLIWAFVETLGSADAAVQEAAFGELVKAKLGFDLLQGTIATLRQDGKADAAFRLELQMDDPGSAIQLRTEGYKSLKLARGEEEALKWLRSVQPASRLHVCAEIFFTCNADELLWTMTTDPDAGHGGARTWLMRAAAWLRESPPSGDHREKLLAYYESKRASPSFDDRLGATLLGLEPEDALLASLHSEEELSLAATMLGLRAEGQHRPRHALRLYQLARSNAHRSHLANSTSQEGLSRLQESWGRPEQDANAATQ